MWQQLCKIMQNSSTFQWKMVADQLWFMTCIREKEKKRPDWAFREAAYSPSRLTAKELVLYTASVNTSQCSSATYILTSRHESTPSLTQLTFEALKHGVCGQHSSLSRDLKFWRFNSLSLMSESRTEIKCLKRRWSTESQSVLPDESKRPYTSGRKDNRPWTVMRAATNWATHTTAFLTRRLPVASRIGRTEYQLLLMKTLIEVKMSSFR